ncbi:glycosyltransferase family 87 protein [Neorhizobium huautlense]|uniref:glycosyltransferase family 87 protein n=1 Tax=Neorhizobium huautlense TaxID=67774 RepID=UPI000CF977D6|nr:glycosyltransferase family 87 protein [Neorhizobium huautlense]
MRESDTDPLNLGHHLMIAMGRFAKISNPLISIAILALAFAMLYAVGIQGVMKAGPIGDDFMVFYRAGGLFLRGGDPWLALMNSPQPYSYPPHSLSIIVAFGLLPQSIALALHIAICLGAIAAMCYCANQWFLNIKSFRSMTIAQALALALIIGNPYTATSLYQGQMTLPVMAALLLSWHFRQKDRWVTAGVFLAFATLKPQLSVLYVIWLLMSANIGMVLVGGSLAGLMTLPGALLLGPLKPFESWLTSLGGYSQVSINAPGSPFVVGMESLLVAHGLEPDRLWLILLCLAGTALLFRYRRHLDQTVILHALLVLSFTFLYAHDYDYVAVILLWSYGMMMVLHSASFAKLSLYAILALGFFIPQRLLRDVDIPLIVHSRTLILAALCLAVIVWSNEISRTAAPNKRYSSVAA